jgi:hypothetical protein
MKKPKKRKVPFDLWIAGRPGEYFGCARYQDEDFLSEPCATEEEAMFEVFREIRLYLSKRRLHRGKVRAAVKKAMQKK